MTEIVLEVKSGQTFPGAPYALEFHLMESRPSVLWRATDGQGRPIVQGEIDADMARRLTKWLGEIYGDATVSDAGEWRRDSAPVPVASTTLPPGRISEVARPFIRCASCTAEAQFITWSGGTPVFDWPACADHRQDCYRGLPRLAAVQLACLWLVDLERGATTRRYAELGAPSWTVRGTGQALYQLERHGLVQADRSRRARTWNLSPLGATLAPWLRLAP